MSFMTLWREKKDSHVTNILTKVDALNLVTHPTWIHIFEWYVIKCTFKDRHLKDMCSKEIKLHAQNKITILSSIVNIIWGDHV